MITTVYDCIVTTDHVQGRLEILKVYTSRKPILDLNLEDIARQTDGFTGADLENLCNEVATHSLS